MLFTIRKTVLKCIWSTNGETHCSKTVAATIFFIKFDSKKETPNEQSETETTSLRKNGKPYEGMTKFFLS